MTIQIMLEKLKPFKPMSRETLYANLRRLKIKPLGARQIPQRYPDDSADRILIRLGFNPRRPKKTFAQPLNGRSTTPARQRVTHNRKVRL